MANSSRLVLILWDHTLSYQAVGAPKSDLESWPGEPAIQPSHRLSAARGLATQLYDILGANTSIQSLFSEPVGINACLDVMRRRRRLLPVRGERIVLLFAVSCRSWR